ncbi:MAG TPA: hypothetical protein VNH46_07495 [Gemmatimonadales bacterium]|nr:hypothetical protein [Gemmatimonadales bacterium]
MGDSLPTGTAVERYFFSPLYYPRSPWAVVRWWESRRLFYNLSVGAAGLVTIAAGFGFSVLPPHPVGFAPAWVLVPIYGVLANLCYSLGAACDLLLRRSLGDRAAGLGQALFRYGYAFSIGLTLFPIPLLALGWVLRWFLH